MSINTADHMEPKLGVVSVVSMRRKRKHHAIASRLIERSVGGLGCQFLSSLSPSTAKAEYFSRIQTRFEGFGSTEYSGTNFAYVIRY